MVIAQLEVLGRCLSLCCWYACFLLWPRCPCLHPRAVASSSSWPSSSCLSTHDPPCEQWRAAAVGVIVSPLPSRCAPCFHPASNCSRRQLLSWCQLVPALRCPVVHPASRGSQWRCGHRVPSRVSSAGGVAMRQGVLTSWLSHFPELSDTSYVASHLIYMGRRGWVDWDSPCCQKPKKEQKSCS